MKKSWSFVLILIAITLGLLSNALAQAPTAKVYKPTADKMVFASGSTLQINSGATYIRSSVQKIISGATGRAGATAGWAIPSAHSGFTNAGVAGLPASQTASTLVIPLGQLKVGDTINSFTVVGQIESAGGTVTLDADLRKLTVVAGDNTDASIGAITQISVTADTAVATSKTLATPEVVAANEQFYVLLTGTTAGSTDVQLLGITVTVDEG